MQAPRLTLYSRADCELCEALLFDLQLLPEAGACDLEVCDVDAQTEIRSRWGHKVPVLLLDGQLVCHGRLDALELRKALAARG